MSVAVEFEKFLIDVLENVENDSTTNITSSVDDNSSEVEHKFNIVPPASTFFLGICIGVGFASHALLINRQ